MTHRTPKAGPPGDTVIEPISSLDLRAAEGAEGGGETRQHPPATPSGGIVALHSLTEAAVPAEAEEPDPFEQENPWKYGNPWAPEGAAPPPARPVDERPALPDPGPSSESGTGDDWSFTGDIRVGDEPADTRYGDTWTESDELSISADSLGSSEDSGDEEAWETAESISIVIGDEDDETVDPESETVAEPIQLAKSPVAETGKATMERGIEAYQTGQWAEALSCFETAMRSDPDDSTAQSYLELAHDRYVREHLPGAGLHRVPRLRVGRELLMSIDLDPQAGGVLAMIDGVATFEELETMLSFLDRDTLYRFLGDAFDKGLIEFTNGVNGT